MKPFSGVFQRPAVLHRIFEHRLFSQTGCFAAGFKTKTVAFIVASYSGRFAGSRLLKPQLRPFGLNYNTY
jgi:hypothetical protein